MSEVTNNKEYDETLTEAARLVMECSSYVSDKIDKYEMFDEINVEEQAGVEHYATVNGYLNCVFDSIQRARNQL